MPTARAKKETATATRKVATKVETKTTVEEPVITEKPIEEKNRKREKGIYRFRLYSVSVSMLWWIKHHVSIWKCL